VFFEVLRPEPFPGYSWLEVYVLAVWYMAVLTSMLALGVNLPAHLVIIKTTQLKVIIHPGFSWTVPIFNEMSRKKSCCRYFASF